ncbi:pol- hypothetical protein [Limosa lapponica baueri]|uniref:Rna-directed dna polymerase from mobile element jockey-like n=1 Tax=Limosa lapponica baueri TaxID=1758121 RepID=A0A2I0U6J4_LIMLA|nr:pol- hypothetical protein [Limosa lapponica baueri]
MQQCADPNQYVQQLQQKAVLNAFQESDGQLVHCCVVLPTKVQIGSHDEWSILGPVLFDIFINDSESGIECTASNFTGDTNLSGAVDVPEARDAIQRDLGKINKWARMNLMRINKAKCRVWLHCVGSTPVSIRSMDEGIVSSPVEKDLGLLVEEKLDMSQQCVLTVQKATCILGYIKRNIASRSRELILALHLGLVRSYQEYCLQLWNR